MLPLLRARRSIRRFTSQAISADVVEALREAVLRSPTSRNYESWRFVFVDDPSLLAQLARCKPHGASFVGQAPLAVVVCGDESRSDVWVEDCSIASIVLQLAAQALELGSCWVQVRLRPHDEQRTAEAFVQELLGLPPQVRVESIIAIGHPAEERAGRASDTLAWDHIRQNRWE
jgi:nitroreductase